jgi:hypothetical protein
LQTEERWEGGSNKLQPKILPSRCQLILHEVEWPISESEVADDELVVRNLVRSEA